MRLFSINKYYDTNSRHHVATVHGMSSQWDSTEVIPSTWHRTQMHDTITTPSRYTHSHSGWSRIKSRFSRIESGIVADSNSSIVYQETLQHTLTTSNQWSVCTTLLTITPHVSNISATSDSLGPMWRLENDSSGGKTFSILAGSQALLHIALVMPFCESSRLNVFSAPR